MSNLAVAETSLLAELEHAKQGLSFYQARIDALEKTLSHLANMSGGGWTWRWGTRSLGCEANTVVKNKLNTARGAEAKSGANALPFTR